MTAFIIRRLLIAVVLLFCISLISFFIITLTPGSPYPWGDLNPKISEAVKQNYRKKFHLDRPIYEQYTLIMSDLFWGELVSNKDERPVLAKIGERMPATMLLNFVSLLITYGFGIPLGIFAARYVRRAPDTILTAVAFLFIALPGFWISYLSAIFLVKYVGVPLLGLSTFGVVYETSLQAFLDRAWHVFLPAIVLSLGGIAVQSRYVRASMLEALREDYIRTARAKGLPDAVVFYKHAFRNSARPLITGLGFVLPAMLGGSVIIESIFAYPGMGLLGYQAVLERDYPVLVTLNFVTAGLVLLGTLVADLLYAIVDPRVRLQ
jgi:peptide/nickel transport system permease protein